MWPFSRKPRDIATLPMTESKIRARRFAISRTGWIVALTLFLFLAVICIPPAMKMYWEIRYYGEAEAVVADIQAMTRELTPDFDEADVRQRLASEQYSHLQEIEIKVELQRGEMIWFDVNERFNVGLGNDGRVL